MTKIKLCGLSRQEDIAVANSLHPEYVGFIFVGASKRFVSKATVKELKSRLDPRICAVGVFSDSPVEEVAALLKEGVIDAAQLHGGESEEYIKKLKLTGKMVIKAFGVKDESDILSAENSPADFILLDAERGGSGKQFDYGLLKKIKRQYFLAGGLDPYNVKQIVGLFKPYAVDVSSGIETQGNKDAKKMTQFVDAVRRANGRED